MHMKLKHYAYVYSVMIILVSLLTTQVMAQ